MRKHIILFFSALLVLSACKPDKNAVGVIGEDDMVKLMVDVHLVDGYLAMYPNNDSLFRYGTGRYEYVFKKHNTDSAGFKKSFRYYSMHDEQLVKIYEQVNKILQAKSDSLIKIVEKEQEAARKRDEKEAKRKSKITQDSLKKVLLEQQKIVKKDSIARAKKDSIQKAKAAKKNLLKPKKLNNTKIK